MLQADDPQFAPESIGLKILISVGIGLLVGFEREWSNKDVGVRSFALASLLGMLSSIIGPTFAAVALIAALTFIVFVNIASFRHADRMEITTSIALVITVMLGILVGLGHHFAPIAAAIIMTMLLAWKQELHRFAGGLSPEEIRSAVLLGLIGFVIYPALPGHFIDPWGLVNPRLAWITIVIVALLGFVNYVLLRVYSTHGLYYTAVLGGLVNSTATISELAAVTHGDEYLVTMTTGLVLLATVSMFARNLLLLAIFSPRALAEAAPPLVAMSLVAMGFAYSMHRAQRAPAPAHIGLGSPVSLKRVFTFGVLFIAIAIFGTIAQRFLGDSGVLVVSAIGGFVSSAGTTAAAANMAHTGKITPAFAGLSTVLASITSAAVNLPIIFKLIPSGVVRNKITASTAAMIVVGAFVAIVVRFF